MPWEKSFNEEYAIKAAMSLFWKKGFAETSMADVLNATGLTKGSFYNAFGSKKEIFIQSLLKYDLENRRHILQQLTAKDQPYTSIEEFLNLIVEECIQDTEKKGCFLINTSLELHSHDLKIQEIIRSSIKEVETFFKQMIELGQLRKEISSELSSEDLSKSLMGTVAAIRILGRGIYDRAALQTLARQALLPLTKI